MSDLFARLAHRALGLTARVEPKLPARFAALPELAPEEAPAGEQRELQAERRGGLPLLESAPSGGRDAV